MDEWMECLAGAVQQKLYHKSLEWQLDLLTKAASCRALGSESDHPPIWHDIIEVKPSPITVYHLLHHVLDSSQVQGLKDYSRSQRQEYLEHYDSWKCQNVSRSIGIPMKYHNNDYTGKGINSAYWCRICRVCIQFSKWNIMYIMVMVVVSS